MINIFKNQKPFAKNDQKALAKNENFSKFKICKNILAGKEPSWAKKCKYWILEIFHF